MLEKRRSGRASTKTSIGDEIARLRGLDLKGPRDGGAYFRDRRPCVSAVKAMKTCRIPLEPGPRSADRAGSPAAVSQKREFFKCPPETIGYFAPRILKIGAWRPLAKSQKPAIGGPFCEYQGQFLRTPDCVAGAGGFEPPYGGIKIRLLSLIYQRAF
jgi:hypothetical protein